jgi:hypothetical protein
VSAPRRPHELYAEIFVVSRRWAGVLIPLAILVFVPVGLVHAIPVHADLESLSASGALRFAAALLAVLVLGFTGLVGEVFYTGAVAIALIHPRGRSLESLREVAGMVQYGRLIAVDLLYGLLVLAGLAALFVPGVLLYVYLGLAAPAVEIERHGVLDSFRRSFDLVRGHFWLAFAVLVPFELAGDALTGLATHFAGLLFGSSLIAEWLADATANVLFTPFYAVAAVLLTLDLIAARDGTAPRLHSEPATA